MKLLHQTEETVLKRVIILSGLLALLVSLLVLAGWISGSRSLASLFPQYLPMAPATAILSAGFALVLLSGGYRTARVIYKSFIIGMVSLFSLYAFLKFLEYFLKTDLTTDPFFLPIKETLGQFPTNRMSPVSGFLFFLCGVAILLKILGKERLQALNLVASLGLIIATAGFSGLVDYLYGTPVLYGSNMIPLSLPTTIAFLMLGWGLVAMGGKKTIILRYVFGSTASARILRAVIPILALSLLADDILNAVFIHFISENLALSSTASLILIIPITVWIMIRTSQSVFLKADQAEEARKQALASLKVSEERYTILVRNIGEGIIVADLDENFVFVNPAAERIFGVPTGGLVGHSLRDFLSPEQFSMVVNETAKRALTEQSTYELEILTPDNHVRNLLMTGTPYMNSDGEFTRSIGILRDISERKKNEAELEKIAKELHESNATKDKFFSIIAHDLKSPFNSILGLTDLLINDSNTLGESDKATTLTMIKQSSEAVFELLENLLVWANSQTGLIQYKPGKIKLQNTIQEVLSQVAGLILKKSIGIVTDCNDDYFAFGDKQMISTVLRNLISNSIKFTPANGEIVIAVTLSQNRYEISVKDNGTGIAPDDISKLFRIDSKFSTKGTANEKGTGLGLILCKEFVEKNGGTIWVESEMGKGSKFVFTLPAEG